jgi:diguanylate cyclase (GGDEF)-like protein
MYLHVSFLTLPAGFMAMGMFVILMLASDLSEQMMEIAVRDQLTGVLNRRGLGEQGAAAYARSRRTDSPVSVIITDIDRFKAINDEFGHAVGDEALVHFSRLLLDARRADDVIARIGGEEFAVILPGTDLRNTMKIADSLCAKIEATPMQVDGRELKMTASFGVASISDRDSCLSDTIVRADRALYRSKRAGRNQVDLESSQLMLASDGTLQPFEAV